MAQAPAASLLRRSEEMAKAKAAVPGSQFHGAYWGEDVGGPWWPDDLEDLIKHYIDGLPEEHWLPICGGKPKVCKHYREVSGKDKATGTMYYSIDVNNNNVIKQFNINILHDHPSADIHKLRENLLVHPLLAAGSIGDDFFVAHQDAKMVHDPAGDHAAPYLSLIHI